MRVALGSDHAGFLLKERIKEYLLFENFELEDKGTSSRERTDYPLFARDVALAVSTGECEQGILVCGTGIGMSIMANKVPGVRCALCHDSVSARYARSHNNANILALGSRIIGVDLALEIVKIYLEATFMGGRHGERLSFIHNWERERE